MAFFLNEIRIEGIPVEQILSCHIDSAAGEHGSMSLTAYIANEDHILFELNKRQPIYLYLDKGGKQYPIFRGVIIQKEIICSGGLLTLQISALSLSYLLDIKKRSRSFQNQQMRYSELLSQVLGEYEGARLRSCFADREIGSWLIQYEETDWEFLRRIMSHLNVMLTPEVSSQGISIYAGIPQVEVSRIPYTVRTVSKDLYSFYHMAANHQEVSAADYTTYQIESSIVRELFAQIDISGIPFVIQRYQFDFSKEQLQATYGLMKREGIRIAPIEQYGITGVALGGRIAAVDRDLVRVSLDIDGSSEAAPVFWLPYSTVSAASDGTGWYCMPEHGDLVKVYFPTKEVRQAIALNAVSGYLTPLDDEDKMGDTRRVYLSTVHNKKMILDAQGASISTDNEAARVSVGADGSIGLYASMAINMLTEKEGDIVLKAGNDVSMNVRDEAGIVDEKEVSAIVLNELGQVAVLGTNIEINEV